MDGNIELHQGASIKIMLSP